MSLFSCLYGPSPSSRQLYLLHQSSDEEDEEVSCSECGSPSVQQVYPAQEGTDDPPRKRKRHGSVSHSPSEETPQFLAAVDASNVSAARMLSWHPDERSDGLARIALPELESGVSEKATQGSSYDIFGDVVDETILAGNIMSAERNSFDGSSPSPNQPISRHHSPSPEQSSHRQPSGSAEQSREHLQKQNVLPWKKEEDGSSNLKISILSRTTAPKTPEHDDDNNMIIPKEGWMQFLA
ncbi:hypothetical protein ANCCAN_22394 [Ancylostoma caninum]|uniref:Uncharacterized protein n=1 Tax=Ancylostoma caninum TaxID=29170 RepID=A0A368FNP3_ANCCA|nr:hypothetical protein ANCCAN_22394 [Ancylostoma caninum]